MKKVLVFPSLLGLIVLFALQGSVSSCTKETVIKDTAISLELLTANSWKMEEQRGVKGNTYLYYKRGGTSNTVNYDVEYFLFNSNKTGTYFDGDGYTHQITWEFSNAENTKLNFVVQNPSPLPSHSVVWENIRYKNNSLLFDEYWTYQGVNSHSQGVRVPK